MALAPGAERRPAPGPALPVRGGGGSAASRDAFTLAICCTDGAPLGVATVAAPSADCCRCAAGFTAATGAGGAASVRCEAGWASCCSSAAVSVEAAVLHRLLLPLAAPASLPVPTACLLSWLVGAARELRGRAWVAGAGSGRTGLGLTARTARGSSEASGERSATRAPAAPPLRALASMRGRGPCGTVKRCCPRASPWELGARPRAASSACCSAGSGVEPPLLLPATAAAARRGSRGRLASAVQRQARKQRCSVEACRRRAMPATKFVLTVTRSSRCSCSRLCRRATACWAPASWRCGQGWGRQRHVL